MLEACTSGIIVCIEPYQDVNASLVIFPGTCTPAQPGCLRRWIMAAKRHLLERERVRLPRRVDPPPPSTTLSEEQVCGLATALKHVEHNRMAALSRTPLAGVLANGPRDYLTAWALLGTWTCTLVWHTSDNAKWPKACFACNDQLRERIPHLGAWARSSFEQGELCALTTMTSDQASYVALPGDAFFQCRGIGPCLCKPPRAVLPLVIHYYHAPALSVAGPLWTWLPSALLVPP